MSKRCLSHIGVWGSNMCVFTKRSAIKKVLRLEEMKIIFIDLKWINAEGKGTLLGKGL